MNTTFDLTKAADDGRFVASTDDEASMLYRSPGEEDKSHDYNPSWDYDVDVAVAPEIVQHVHTSCGRIHAELRKAGIIDRWMFGFEIWAAHLPPNAVAMYIAGTYDWPVVLLDIPKHSGDLSITFSELTKSIRHELKHAIQESKDEEFDEDEAEDDGPFVP